MFKITGQTGQQVTMAVLSSAALSAIMLTGCHPTDRRPEPPKPPQVAECAREDSVACTWHADLHGNGEGLSYDVSAQGEVIYWGPAEYRAYHSGH